ncbi:hypothetical protein JCM5296_000757 [Sporobolomyces johnsonii]
MAHVGNWFTAQQKFKADNLACSGGLSIVSAGIPLRRRRWVRLKKFCAAGDLVRGISGQMLCCLPECSHDRAGDSDRLHDRHFRSVPFIRLTPVNKTDSSNQVNLLFVLIYKSEAPYNLAFQLLATDGALFGLLDRLLEPKNRLTEFHYSFTPMLIMSAVPIALVFWVFIGHIMAWIAVFLYNYAANDDFFQSNCSDTFPLRSYRIAIGAVVASWCCIALLFWSALGLGLSAKNRGRTYKLDVIEVIASVLHWRKLQIWAQPRPNGGKFKIFRKTVTSREAIRWSIALGMYVIWVAEFLGFYFSSLQSFVMMGDNPFDYGQVAACIGIVVPVVIVGRRVSMLKKEALRVDERPISPPRDGRNSNSRSDSPTRYDSILPDIPSPNEPGERHRSSSSTPHRPSLGDDDEGYMMTKALAPQNTTSRDRMDDVQEEGLCNIVPISGPGTFLAFVLGSLFNLLYALHFTPEAPYNMALQLVSVDGALLSILDRFFEPENRISMWHFSFVGLSIVSVVPVAVACSLVIDSAAGIRLRAASQNRAPPVPPSERYSSSLAPARSVVSRPSSRHSVSESFRPALRPPSIVRTAPDLQPSGRREVGQTWLAPPPAQHSLLAPPPAQHSLLAPPPAQHSLLAPPPAQHSLLAPPPAQHSGLAASIVSNVNSDTWKERPHKLLPRIVFWVFTVHLAAFAIVFIIVYGFVNNTLQPYCVDPHHLYAWRIIMGTTAASFVLLGAFFWVMLYRNIFRPGKGLSYSGVMALASLASSTRVHRWARKNETKIRWTIGLTVWGLWATTYITIYITALQNFLMQGSNPWPKVNLLLIVVQCTRLSQSALAPAVVVARGWLDKKDGFDAATKAREQVAKTERLREEIDELETELARLEPPSRFGSRAGGHAAGVGEDPGPSEGATTPRHRAGSFLGRSSIHDYGRDDSHLSRPRSYGTLGWPTIGWSATLGRGLSNSRAEFS